MAAYKRNLRRYFREFLGEKKDGRPFTKEEIARWALSTGRIRRERGYADRLVEQKLAGEFAEVMREETTTDSKGRTTREMLAARVSGVIRWNSRDRSDRRFAELSYGQRREMIVADCSRLKTDVDSFNETFVPEDPIQMTFDFRNDLAELEAGEAAQRDAS